VDPHRQGPRLRGGAAEERSRVDRRLAARVIRSFRPLGQKP